MYTTLQWLPNPLLPVTQSKCVRRQYHHWPYLGVAVPPLGIYGAVTSVMVVTLVMEAYIHTTLVSVYYILWFCVLLCDQLSQPPPPHLYTFLRSLHSPTFPIGLHSESEWITGTNSDSTRSPLGLVHQPTTANCLVPVPIQSQWSPSGVPLESK